MNPDEPMKLLKQMLEMYTPSGREVALACFLKEKMTEFGFGKVRMDEAGNVLGEVGGGSPRILLCGHMDTVPGRLPVKIENHKIYGRGAVDAKSSLAAMIWSASALKGQEIGGSVLVAAVVDEEGRGRGIRQLLRDKLDVDYAIFGEPSGVSNITIGYRGRLELRILCKTESGHAGAPHVFSNAIEKSYELWGKIREWASRAGEPSRGQFHSSSVCLTGIRAGGATNVVPSSCRLIVDVRLPPSISCQRGIDQLLTEIRRYESKNPRVRLRVTVEDQVEPYIAEKGSLLVEVLRQAIGDTVGGPVRLLRKTGTGDMNVFATEVKAPVVTYGPGNSRLSHTLNEYVEVGEYLASIEVYRKTIEKLFTSRSH